MTAALAHRGDTADTHDTRAADRHARVIASNKRKRKRKGEMASQSQGIQQLLQAEKRAAEKVAEARKRKTRRLKQAKEEAQGEIEQYRAEREREFTQKQHTVLGSQGNLSTEVEQQTRQKIQSMQSSYQRNREKVLRQLLSITCHLNPQIHCNYQITA
ncbi:V-type proton ATPase subunit G 2 [Amia ocellicauda]|uniref:V-type proton ATPase subunit G 2 n=1 Tax=Amia ocellicauda TaxID=2972642 RepID=UPI00346399F4